MSLAVLDWGIGGCGIYKLLRQQHPTLSLLYWSDSGFTPYGKVPRDELTLRIATVFRTLAESGATKVVVACNAASSILPDLTEAQRHGLAIVGMIEPTVALLQGAKPRSLGVVGGIRTIRAGMYGRALKRQGHHVRQRVAQPLSALVEAGELSGAKVEAQIAAILAPLKGIDGLVLACTHYPALGPVFADHLPGVQLIDPAEATMQWIQSSWQLDFDMLSKDPPIIMTTGSPRSMAKAAALAFDVSFPHIQQRPVSIS